MAHRIRIHRTGGPEVLQYEDYDVGEPGHGQVRLAQEAAGVNFVDTQFRDGIYEATLPLTLGVEGAGIIDAVGPGVADLKVGDRVGCWLAFGSYADMRLVDADKLVALPAGLSSERAASIFTKGLSAWAMVKRAHVVRPGETMLVQGASGGVGSLAPSWAQALGAKVIAIVGSPAKATGLRDRGIDMVLDSGDPDLAAKVAAMTGGRSVDVVYELIGAASFDKSVAALRPGGDLVHFGNASGPPRIDMAALAERAISYTKPNTGEFVNSPVVLKEASNDLWSAFETHILKPLPVTSYPLREARRAHEDIRARRVVGSMVLTM
ncbi:quinone oxidoreductase family protein [Lichenifustis flavocetrariae]|uniref:Quinone oxidoreductase n=1 Tax=Lichenifustis flavocetrariae TaxID=2949735 RepID=A0AA42CQJ2_9HYPH|nr:quinone oxidoreductase [Lichenifustis flavocetrariae]MCW6511507.1 quinone oxidoreductase [Lichenifustis flavocetrariae]